MDISSTSTVNSTCTASPGKSLESWPTFEVGEFLDLVGLLQGLRFHDVFQDCRTSQVPLTSQWPQLKLSLAPSSSGGVHVTQSEACSAISDHFKPAMAMHHHASSKHQNSSKFRSIGAQHIFDEHLSSSSVAQPLTELLLWPRYAGNFLGSSRQIWFREDLHRASDAPVPACPGPSLASSWAPGPLTNGVASSDPCEQPGVAHQQSLRITSPV